MCVDQALSFITKKTAMTALRKVNVSDSPVALLKCGAGLLSSAQSGSGSNLKGRRNSRSAPQDESLRSPSTKPARRRARQVMGEVQSQKPVLNLPSLFSCMKHTNA